MSDDDAFLQVLRLSPGDEVARLVYADWLDERADARGPYLRAEAEWARTGKREKALRTLAAPLDPVWVARVSRPPAGVCVDRIVLNTGHPPATPADLDAVEGRLNLKLPAELRALLLNWNGARPAVNMPPQPARFVYGISELQRFLRVLPGGKSTDDDDEDEPEEDLWDLVAAAELFLGRDGLDRYGRPARRLLDYIPIADAGEGDLYLIGVRGSAAGKVAFFHDFTHHAGDAGHLGVVAPSLGRLFAAILAEAPEWYRLARNGDRAALFAWADAGGDVNARDADRHESLLSTAMGLLDVEMVRGLLSRGAKVGRDARELAEMLHGVEGRQIRAAIKIVKPPKKGKN